MPVGRRFLEIGCPITENKQTHETNVFFILNFEFFTHALPLLD